MRPFLDILTAMAFAAVAGDALVHMLMGDARHTWRYRLLTIVALAGALLFVWWLKASAWLWLAIALAVTAFAAGYARRAHVMLTRDDSRYLPERRQDPTSASHPHVAILYLAHGEPVHYDPTGLLSRYRLADRLGLPSMPLLLRPFKARRLRERYRRMGASRNRAIHRRTMQTLAAAMRTSGDGATLLYLSLVEDEPRPDAAQARALNEGATAVVVCEVLLARDLSTRTGAAWIRSHLENAGAETRQNEVPAVPVVFTGPVGSSPHVGQMYLARASHLVAASEIAATGVVVVGRGEPDAWSRRWPDEAAQEGENLRAIAAGFVAAGYPADAVIVAWSDYGRPRLVDALGDLKRSGVTTILVVPATSSADDWHVVQDIPDAIRRARLGAGVRVENLGAWNDDAPAVLAMMSACRQALAQIPATR